MSDEPLHADYASAYDVPTEVWSDLGRVLEAVGHYWQFDARYDEVTCPTCGWYAQAPFLEAVKAADNHRREVKAEVLRALLATLEEHLQTGRTEGDDGAQ